MKQEELNKLVGSKLTAEEQGSLLAAINADTNSIVSERDAKIKTLKEENTTLKNSNDLFTKEKEDYATKLANADAMNDFLNKKNFIYKNVNSNLEDEDVKELIGITKMKEGKFEDVVVGVAKKRNFMGDSTAKAELAPAPKPSSSIANSGSANTDKLTTADTMAWLTGKSK